MRETPVKKYVALAAFAVAGLAGAAQAQINYTFQFRLIPDGAPDAPVPPPTPATGVWSQYPVTTTATRIGFWVQARVMQDGGQNWGIGRFSAPPSPNCDFITVTDAAGGTTLQRGQINVATAATPQNGRGAGYRTGGLNVGATGNASGAAAFPGVTNNENGSFDNGSARIYGMDAYVGDTRADTDGDLDGDLDDDGDGLPENPWRVNGAATPNGATTSGTPVALNTWSPWANLYRVWVVPTNSGSERTITLNVSGQLNGTVQAAPTAQAGSNFALQLGAGQTLSAQYAFTYGIPTPGAAALMGVGMVAAGRRRR